MGCVVVTEFFVWLKANVKDWQQWSDKHVIRCIEPAFVLLHDQLYWSWLPKSWNCRRFQSCAPWGHLWAANHTTGGHCPTCVAFLILSQARKLCSTFGSLPWLLPIDHSVSKDDKGNSFRFTEEFLGNCTDDMVRKLTEGVAAAYIYEDFCVQSFKCHP